MRTLKLQMQTSIDGFIASPNGEMDWLEHHWTDDIKKVVHSITQNVDTIVLGRKLAEGFIPHWTAELEDIDPEEGAEIFVNTPKVVFTKTIENSSWENTTLAKGPLREEIMELKHREGKDMIVYGGCEFVSALIKDRLIDELFLFVNPMALGKGLSIFSNLEIYQHYHIAQVQKFDCGIVLLNYQLKH